MDDYFTGTDYIDPSEMKEGEEQQEGSLSIRSEQKDRNSKEGGEELHTRAGGQSRV